MMFVLFSLLLSSSSTVVAQNCLLQKGSSLATDDLPSFASFIDLHGRTYMPGTEEYGVRHALFEKRVAQVRHHNSQPNQAWSAAVNHLSDRTEEELGQLRGWKGFATVGRSPGQVGMHSHGSQLSLAQAENNVVPDNHTWEHLAAIQAHEDQGYCGSCWALATMTMMNAAAEIAGNNQSFSAQDLVNCVPNPHKCGGSGGCEGATVELAMSWIASNGFRTKDDSPYLGYDDSCYASLLEVKGSDRRDRPSFKYDDELEKMIAIGKHEVPANTPGAASGLKYWTRLPENEYRPVLKHLVEHGPLSVSVAADGWSSYGDGIFTSCSEDMVIDHAVVLFGYGFSARHGLKYWEIKNSWGQWWGRDGNMRLIREDTVPCGTDKQPEVGTGCDGGPKEVKVCGNCGILYDVVSVAM